VRRIAVPCTLDEETSSEQPSQSIPHTPHTRQNDDNLLFSISLPMVLSAIAAAAMSAFPARKRTRHPNPAARKRSLVGRGLQALARGDDERVKQLTQQIEREGLSDV
jgi:hypothetical protein